jgi:rRNA maturation protein Nop10
MLDSYRVEHVNDAQFDAWLQVEIARPDAQIPRGLLLKLKRGSRYVRMSTIGQLLPMCGQCAAVGKPKQFESRSEYGAYSRRRDDVVSVGALVEIKPPAWAHEGPASPGAAMYCRCASCGSLWAFVEPEREHNGSWKRLA